MENLEESFDEDFMSDRELLNEIIEWKDPFRKNEKYFSNTKYRLNQDYTDIEDFERD